MELKNTKKNESKKPYSNNSYLRYSNIGFQFLAFILLGMWGGGWLDKYYQTDQPYFTAGCILFGLVAAFYALYKDLVK